MMAKGYKNIFFMSMTFLMIGMAIIGCSKTTVKKKIKDESTSTADILIGYEVSGGYGRLEDCLPYDLIIRKDKTAAIYMCCTQIAFVDLSDEDYKKIEAVADCNELEKSKISEETDVCDGSSCYIKFYDQNSKCIKSFGGYMPSGTLFDKTRDTILNCVSKDFVQTKVDNYRERIQDSYDKVKEGFKENDNKFEKHHYLRSKAAEYMFYCGCMEIAKISEITENDDESGSFVVKSQAGIKYYVEFDSKDEITLVKNATDDILLYDGTYLIPTKGN